MHDRYKDGNVKRNIFFLNLIIGLDNKIKFSIKLLIFSYLYILTYIFGAHKNHLTETVLLSTHNICFD